MRGVDPQVIPGRTWVRCACADFGLNFRLKTAQTCVLAAALAQDATRQISEALMGNDPLVENLRDAGFTELQATQIAETTDVLTAVFSANRGALAALNRVGRPAAAGGFGTLGTSETVFDVISSANSASQLSELNDLPE